MAVLFGGFEIKLAEFRYECQTIPNFLNHKEIELHMCFLIIIIFNFSD